MVDTRHGFAVLVVAGGVEGLFGEDLSGGRVDDGDDAVGDFQFHGFAGVLPADIDGAPSVCDAFCMMQPSC
ncbi:hypothetical protein [Bifidobacterium felsineum]|uniref:hypothetical protein n=1 Tax=Bifidobacterium felsineum TaxID=2045440 RepID=UPI001BDCB31E|nr:hypothetical protein [Bifidobacterium felsineum]MBT1163768.1 hypothetical protein [Bifidobacterium felsineum]